MHGSEPEFILNLRRDLFDMATWDDYRSWERTWSFRERVRWRVRFWREAFLRGIARSYGWIP